jgi:hypothetical protein
MALDADCWTWLPEELVREIVVRYCPPAWVDGLTPALKRPVFLKEDWDVLKELGKESLRLEGISLPRGLYSIVPFNIKNRGNYLSVTVIFDSPEVFECVTLRFHSSKNWNYTYKDDRQFPLVKLGRPWVDRNPRFELAKRFASIKC